MPFLDFIFIIVMSTYFSVTKFSDTILEKEPDASAIALFFEPRAAMSGNFNNFTIKPIGMIIKYKNQKELYCNHSQLLDLFKGQQLGIYVPFSNGKKIPESDQIHYLEIRLSRIEWSQGYYYYCEIYPSNNKEINEYLIKNKVKQIRRTESQFNITNITTNNFVQ